jgi:hypothetical protein
MPTPSWSNPTSLFAALVLAAVYILGPRALPLERRFPRRTLSVAAGVSLAYIFLDVLPELAVRNRAFVESAGPWRLIEERIYLVALTGFVFLYGLDRMVLAARADEQLEKGGRAASLIFWSHIGGFALYGWIIGDALVGRGMRGGVQLLLFTVAMGLHLLVVASSLSREHGRAYLRWGRWVLAASVVTGWLAAALALLSAAWGARLFAFVAGGVLMTSAKEELPEERGGRVGWFVLGTAAYAALLLLA